jgi:hypothetical protein
MSSRGAAAIGNADFRRRASTGLADAFCPFARAWEAFRVRPRACPRLTDMVRTQWRLAGPHAWAVRAKRLIFMALTADVEPTQPCGQVFHRLSADGGRLGTAARAAAHQD